MELSVVLGSVAIVAALGVLWWAFSPSRAAGAEIDLGSYAIAPRHDLDAAARRREDAEDPSVFGALSRLGRRLTPAGRIASLERRLLAAGSPRGWTADRLLAIKALAAIVAGVLLALQLASGSIGGAVLMGVLGSIMFLYPDARLKSMVEAREDAVRIALAETIDQVTIMVSAGLGLDAAIARTARTTAGPLSAELTRVSHDLRAGIPRAQALLAMAERVELPELRQVMTAIAQSERLGVPISHTLQIQAGELREKRRQHAEEKAMKLPVKILFPTLVCILPALFVVVLGPAAIRIFDSFGG